MEPCETSWISHREWFCDFTIHIYRRMSLPPGNGFGRLVKKTIRQNAKQLIKLPLLDFSFVRLTVHYSPFVLSESFIFNTFFSMPKLFASTAKLEISSVFPPCANLKVKIKVHWSQNERKLMLWYANRVFACSFARLFSVRLPPCKKHYNSRKIILISERKVFHENESSHKDSELNSVEVIKKHQ